MSVNTSRAPLGELLELREPDTPVAATTVYPFAGVYSFGRGVFQSKALAGSEFSYRVLTSLRQNDFVYPKLMAWEGAFRIVGPQCAGRYVSPEFPVFSVRTEKLLPEYLGLYFRKPDVWRAVSGDSKGTNVRRRRLHPNQLLNFAVPLPPLPEQQRVVGQIAAIASRITERHASVKSVEAEVQALLAAAFVHITKGATRSAMTDVAPLARRTVAIDLEGSYPELGIRSFGKGTFHKPALSGAEVGSKRLFRIESDDLLFNIVFAWEGAVAVARDDDHGRFGSHRFLTCVTDQSRATAEFLRYYFLTPEGLARLREASPGGAGRNRTLGLEALGQIQVPTPPIADQRWFDELQRKAAVARTNSVAATSELDKIVPAMLTQLF